MHFCALQMVAPSHTIFYSLDFFLRLRPIIIRFYCFLLSFLLKGEECINFYSCLIYRYLLNLDFSTRSWSPKFEKILCKYGSNCGCEYAHNSNSRIWISWYTFIRSSFKWQIQELRLSQWNKDFASRFSCLYYCRHLYRQHYASQNWNVEIMDLHLRYGDPFVLGLL